MKGKTNSSAKDYNGLRWKNWFQELNLNVYPFYNLEFETS